MAAPYDEAVLLSDVTNLLKETYRDGVPETFGRHYRRFNKLIRMNTEVAKGDGYFVTVNDASSDTFRVGRNPLPDSLGTAAKTSIQKFKLRFNENAGPAGTDHDFTMITGASQFTQYELDNGGEQAVIDLVRKIDMERQQDFEQKKAFHRVVGSTGVLCYVNGTPKQGDALTYAGATSGSVSNTTGIRILVDNGSIGFFATKGLRLDFIRPATGAVVAGNVKTEDLNTADGSVRISYGSGSSHVSEQSTGNLASVADNDYIVISGTYNKAGPSVRNWFTTPTAGESFLGGKDRTTAAFSFMNPTTTRSGDAVAKVQQSFFNNLATAMRYRFEPSQTGMVAVGSPEVIQAIQEEIGQNSWMTEPTTKRMQERFGSFGWMGVTFQHTEFGVMQLLSEVLMPPNDIWFIEPNSWIETYYQVKGLRTAPGDTEGMWSRMSSGSPNSGKGLAYRAEFYANLVDWCEQPYKQGRIANVSAT
jgi:hypothetical protein